MKTLEWHFDIYSALFTALFIPVFFFFLKIVRTHIINGTSYVVNGLFYFFASQITKAASARLTLRRYCRTQLAGHSKSLDVPAYNPIPIDQLFVPLVLETAGSHAPRDHTSLLSAGDRIQVVGDPGSGKSTILKRLFRDECKRALNETRRSKFPMLIELRHLKIPTPVAAKQLGPWMLQYLRDEASRTRSYKVESCFDAYAATTGLLILLDGLDEVNSSNFNRIKMALYELGKELSGLGSNNCMVCTLRTQFYYQVKEEITTIFPVFFSIKKFTPTDMYTFLHQWPFEGVDSNRERMRIFNDLADRPSLREMCTNPLILSMYVAQDQSHGAALAPESRTQFYARVTEELILRRRARQVGRQKAQTVLLNQRMEILGRIAYRHLVETTNAANLLSWGEVIKAVRDVTKKSVKGAEDYFRELSKETGIITEEREGEICRFIHLTFCEFLAAHQAVQGSASAWGRLVLRHSELLKSNAPALRTRLIEVIPFLCALLPRHSMPDALEALKNTGDRRALTMAFLETKIYNHDSWLNFIDTRGQELLRLPLGDRDTGWLEDVHLFIVVCKDAERSKDLFSAEPQTNSIEHFFKSIAGEPGQSLSGMISIYADHDAVAAFRIAGLCGLDIFSESPGLIIKSCDQPPFVALLIEQAPREKPRLLELACLFAEAGLKSPAANATLEEVESDLFRELADEAPADKRWYARGWIDRNFFTECLTVALFSGDKAEFKLLSLYRSLPACQWVSSRCWKIMALATGVYVGGICLASWPLTFVSIGWWQFSMKGLFWQLPGFIVAISGLKLFREMMRVRRGYRRIVYRNRIGSPGALIKGSVFDRLVISRRVIELIRGIG